MVGRSELRPAAAPTRSRASSTQKLQEIIGGSVVVENKPGASGRLAPDSVAKSTPDGYTLLGASSRRDDGRGGRLGEDPYDIFKDFVPISLMADYPLVVLVNKDHPAQNIAELVAWLKANPDKANYPTPGLTFTLPIEHFKLKTGAPATAISYRSSNESVTSLLGSQTAFGFRRDAGRGAAAWQRAATCGRWR